MDIREELTTLVAGLLQEGGFDESAVKSENLVSGGYISSMEVVEIATHMEERYDLDFGKIYFDLADFESIASMVRLVENHLPGA